MPSLSIIRVRPAKADAAKYDKKQWAAYHSWNSKGAYEKCCALPLASTSRHHGKILLLARKEASVMISVGRSWL